ncbi:hypothetical protein MEQU1_000810 [Malassezia equina]|uniref:Uncharacterized protein n=1 Tax=Malassezia equina TaxID=1381935 RepID=A0AAF0IZ60_9BASI|nr:hypothetical protein MEQU1_000810 [Malassezia equina]
MARTSAFEQEHAIPFTIQGLKNEYEKLDKEIKYSVSLDAGKLNELQARFMNSSAKHQAPEKVFLDHPMKENYRLYHQPFILMGTYDHINLYAEPTLLRDQNALEAKTHIKLGFYVV